MIAEWYKCSLEEHQHVQGVFAYIVESLDALT